MESVYIFAAQAGFREILPCKGRSPWQQGNANIDNEARMFGAEILAACQREFQVTAADGQLA